MVGRKRETDNLTERDREREREREIGINKKGCVSCGSTLILYLCIMYVNVFNSIYLVAVYCYIFFIIIVSTKKHLQIDRAFKLNVNSMLYLEITLITYI